MSATCALALVLVFAKAASDSRAITIVASSYRDLFFAVCAGAIAAAVLSLARRWNVGAAIVRSLALVIFALFAGYAIAAVGLFRYFHRPVTYDLLTLVGNAAAVRSSIFQRITPAIGVGIVAAPLFLLVASRFTIPRTTLRVAAAIAALWIGTGWALSISGWESEHLEYLALSPHGELLRTVARRLVGTSRAAFPKDFPTEYLDEFRTVRARKITSPAGFALTQEAERPRNVIVVVLESVGTKYLGLYGNPNDITPNLSAAAQNALVFDNIYAHASFTYASFRPLNFSVYPGLPWHYALLQDARPLPKTLASLMRARGVRTGYFTSGDLDWGDQRWLLEKGGDFETLQGAADLGCPLLSSWGTEDRCAFERLVKWIDEKPNESFFSVVWTDQTHDPFLLSPGTSRRASPAGKFGDDVSRYLTNLAQVDAQIGRLLEALRERGLADDTLVVVTGDHGEAFGDPHQQRGHAWSVYDEEVRVPLLLWNPRLFPEGKRISTVGGQVDINPTVADLLDVSPADEWQGRSLFDPQHPGRAYFMAIAGGDLFGVRDGEWKYIYDVTSARESLFNLTNDPHEQHNVAPNEAGRTAELRRRVAAWVSFEDAYLWGREN
ncbi:MAG: sulfatase [Chthoniobacterales bacterium]